MKYSLKTVALLVVFCSAAGIASAQNDEIDELDPPDVEALSRGEQKKRAVEMLGHLSMRVCATDPQPAEGEVLIEWRHGGEDLGGRVTTGEFKSAGGDKVFRIGEWSVWTPLKEILPANAGWHYPTLTINRNQDGKPLGLESVKVDFEFAADGKVIKTFTETAPQGSTVSFVFPGKAMVYQGVSDPDFIEKLRGLSGHARARFERLNRKFSIDDLLPKQFAFLGRLGGYAPTNGRKIRHNNPEIVRDEIRTMRLLGINGLISRREQARELGMGQELERLNWAGPGAPTPMSEFYRRKDERTPSPFAPELKEYIEQTTAAEIEKMRAVGTQEVWAQWGDEIGVAFKFGLDDDANAQAAFREYLRSQNVTPQQVGADSWPGVLIHPLYAPDAKGTMRLMPAPASATEALRFYYTYRFLTYATGKMFAPASKQFKAAGFPMFSMQAPTPTWSGSSFDWFEFYDQDANGAFVFETSNRDARVWALESYLSDIARSIALRKNMEIGALVKPHRGAPAQRTLSAITRGARVFQWYTYGPDYSKGDSFSQYPERLDEVAQTARFVARAEDYLYEAKWLTAAEVAFITPRSSEIWSRADPDANVRVLAGRGAEFEDSKWIYLALNHAHIPVDILSEQQLAEGKLSQYKVIYITGPNLHRNAATQVKKWVSDGGLLWTNALGLSRDEANQPLTMMEEVLGLSERKMETWGNAPRTGATGLNSLAEEEVPAASVLKLAEGAALSLPGATESETFRAYVSREVRQQTSGSVLASYADGKPAVTRNSFGKGAAITVGMWPGIAYSDAIRQPEYDISRSYSDALRALIAGPAIARNVARPVIPNSPAVEAVLLEKNGKRSVALMNWAYKNEHVFVPLENLKIALPGVGDFKTVRSLQHGVLPVRGEGENRTVVLPKLDEVDLLILD